MSHKVMEYRLKEEFLDTQQEIEKGQLQATLGLANVATTSEVMNLVTRQKEEVEQLRGLWPKRIADMAKTLVYFFYAVVVN